MKKMRNISVIVIMLLGLSACENFLEVDSPVSKIDYELVFATDESATSAMLGVYRNLSGSSDIGFATGSINSIVTLAGLSADELRNNLSNTPMLLDFQNNEIRSDNAYIGPQWTSMYSTIYYSNAVLEGIASSKSITPSVRDQLRGEALAIRAFCHFYLINTFGDSPLVLTTDYNINRKLARTPVEDVYDQVIDDLLEAESLLSEVYVTEGRVRINKSIATALLARAYLYTKDWARAEEKATGVISKTSLYSLAPVLDNVFKANSTEAIWQFTGCHSLQGRTFGVETGALQNNVLRSEIMDEFEPNDKRKVSWTTSVISPDDTVYLPYKYKMANPNCNLAGRELSTVIRLAELILIRAEARARQGKLTLAIDDLDEIRYRAGLPLIKITDPGIEEDELLLAILQERRIEMMVEWGHRWYDLKRFELTDEILGAIKTGWDPEDELYPVPAEELRKNPRLNPQNPGY